jgi:hypothetical protein
MSQFIYLEIPKKYTKFCCHELRVFCRVPEVSCNRALPSLPYEFPQYSQASVGIVTTVSFQTLSVHASSYPSTLHSVAADSVVE